MQAETASVPPRGTVITLKCHKLTAAAISAVIAIACGVAASPDRLWRPVTSTVLTNLSTAEIVSHKFIDITFLPAISLLMTALHYMVSGLMNYEARARLVEWCVSVPVMMLNIAALSGVTDSANLAAVAICSCICMLLGLVQEGSRNTLLGTSVTGSVFNRFEDYVVFTCATLLIVFVWCVIIVQTVRTGPPTFVYSIVVLECIGFAVFPVLFVWQMPTSKRELAMLVASVVVKSLLAIIQTAGTRAVAGAVD